mmetsp:Transcript_115092/g.325210  ORF Transcript_115092/g.325210 Transcript_115092/m.325210 type:complete len:298 (+) Transcript_115092:100-993(+)
MGDSERHEAKRQRTMPAADDSPHGYGACSGGSSSSTSLLVDLASPLATVEVETGDRGHVATFQVHRGAIEQLPYLKAYAERWAHGDPLRVQLPRGVEVTDFKDLLVYAYTGRLPRRSDLAGFAKHVKMYRLVDMMLAEDLIPETLARICEAVRCPEELEELRQLASVCGLERISVVVAEIEMESEDPFLGQLVKSVVGNGRAPIGNDCGICARLRDRAGGEAGHLAGQVAGSRGHGSRGAGRESRAGKPEGERLVGVQPQRHHALLSGRDARACRLADGGVSDRHGKRFRDGHRPRG